MTENPYAMGPPEDYHPTPAEDLVNPEVYRTTAERGRAKVLATLAECGITKNGRGWTVAPRDGRSDR